MDKFKIPAGTRLAHAYIAASMNEDVRNSLARTLAAAMLCEADGEARPCGRCAACRKSLKGLHPDITVITPGLDSKGRKKREITVDIVRALSSEAQVVPNEARRKAFIIEDADTMNRQAQNAFLKLLEEPPETASFILCAANPGLLLDTVRSRCEQIRENADAEESEEASSDALALLGAISAGDRCGLLLWCCENEGMDSRRCAAMLRAAREKLADILLGRLSVSMDVQSCARLDALLSQCSEYLRQNVGVKNVLALIAADGIQK